MNFKKSLILAGAVICLPVFACKIKLVNDSTVVDKNIRLLINDESAADLKDQVKGRTLRKLGAKKVAPTKSGYAGSKYKISNVHVFEKVGKNQYKRIAVINQTQQAGKGQEVCLTVSDLKKNNVDAQLLQVQLV